MNSFAPSSWLSATAAARLARLNCVLVAVLALVALTFGALLSSEGGLDADYAGDLVLLPLIMAIAVMGALVVSRHPGHVIGAGLTAVSTLMVTVSVTNSYVGYGLAAGESLPLMNLVAWVETWVWVPASFPLMTLLLLYCPDGRLLSRGWAPVTLVVFLATATLVLALAFKPGVLTDYETIENPFGVAWLKGEAGDLIALLGYGLLLATVVLSAVAMHRRFRASQGRERLQLKWFALAGVAAAAMFSISFAINFLYEDIWAYTFPITIALGPMAAGIAILKHQLYDIDRIINRAVVYTVLTAGLAASFAALVLTLQVLSQPLTGSSDLAVAASTLAVAALFQPARRYVQEGVDRRFNRRKYDAQQTIAAFSGRLREAVELETLSDDLIAVVHETMQPSQASLWLRATR